MQLQIYHSGWRDSLPMFEVVRSTDMKRTTEIQVPSPMTFPVINRPADMLLPELRWYMEDYLRTPFGAYRSGEKRCLICCLPDMREIGTKRSKGRTLRIFGSKSSVILLKLCPGHGKLSTAKRMVIWH